MGPSDLVPPPTVPWHLQPYVAFAELTGHQPGVGPDGQPFDIYKAYSFQAEDDRDAAAEAGEGEEEELPLRQGLRELREDFEARRSALEMVEGKGRALGCMQERFRRDPDVVVLAVGSCAEAMQFASPKLCSDHDFALEAVQWNWRALQFLPEAFRGDRGIVRAAARQNLDALALAAESLRDDEGLAAEARAGVSAGLPCCEDESLRLVGPFNEWRTTDALLRFRRVPSPNRSVARHRLLVHLGTGCLGFQVVSCVWQSAVRIFPLKGGDKTHYRLVRGDPSAITAAIGGEEEGESDFFYIDEGAGAIVSIYVELSSGARTGQAAFGKVQAPTTLPRAAAVAGLRRGTARRSAVRRRAAVWYCREKDDFSVPEGIVTLSQPSEADCCKSASSARAKPRGAKVVDKEVLADVEKRDDLQKLVLQAEALSERAFPQQFAAQDLGSVMHLALLVDSSHEEVLGYCLYKILEQERALWVEQVAVAEGRRGHGLGRDLISWATEKAGSARCSSVRLNSRNRALGFYMQLGFASLPDATSPGCRTLELRLLPPDLRSANR